jgi:hypothetical protein
VVSWREPLEELALFNEDEDPVGMIRRWGGGFELNTVTQNRAQVCAPLCGGGKTGEFGICVVVARGRVELGECVAGRVGGGFGD